MALMLIDVGEKCLYCRENLQVSTVSSDGKTCKECRRIMSTEATSEMVERFEDKVNKVMGRGTRKKK